MSRKEKLNNRFNGIISSEQFLPESSYQQWSKSQVRNFLPTKGFLQKDLDNFGMPQKIDCGNIIGEFFILSKEGKEENSEYSFMEKTCPHAQFEIMIMQTGDIIKPHLCDMKLETQQQILDNFETFIKFAENKDHYPYISWSWDPDTVDRETAQSIKRFHSHLIVRSREDLQNIEQNKQTVESQNSLDQRILVDETSVIASRVMHDYLQSQTNFELLLSFDGANQSPNLCLDLGKEISSISSQELLEDINKFHQSYIGIRNIILDIILEDGQEGVWQRRLPRNIKDEKVKTEIIDKLNELEFLSPESIEMILHFVSKLKPSILNKIDRIKDKKEYEDIINHIYPLAGPCYSTAIFRNDDGNIHCMFRPYFFSSLGGAGISNLKQTVVKTKKNIGRLTKEEVEQRKTFQEEYLNKVRKKSQKKNSRQ